MNGETEDSADKPHDPTPRKLEQAREKGEIVRSADLNTAVVYGGFLLFGLLFAPWFVAACGQLMIIGLDRAEPLSAAILAPGGGGPAAGLLAPSLAATAAVLAAPAGLLVIALIAQRGIVVAPEKLMPKLSRISPIENAKQKFGAEGLFQFAKSAVKLIVVSILLAVYLWARAEAILMSVSGTPGQILGLTGELVAEFMAVVAAMSFVMGGIDWAWEWARLLRRNRMSHEELRDEAKTSEGDPYLKLERRMRGQRIAANRMMADVPSADVVVVNPTHYAVALKWNRKAGQVPVCVAKGVDETAARIRRAAAEAGVPVFSDPATARALFATVEIGAVISPDHFRAVAAAIRFADAVRGRARRRGGSEA